MRLATRRRGARTAWLPVLLRWRKPHKPPVRLRAQRAALFATSFASFPQFHFHIDARVGAATRVFHRNASFRTDRQIVVHRHSTSMRTTTLAATQQLLRRELVRFFASNVRVSKTSVFHHTLQRAATTHIISRRSSGAARVEDRHSCLSGQAGVPVLHFGHRSTHVATHTYWRERQTIIREAAKPLPQTNAPLPPPALRTELVWRREQRSEITHSNTSEVRLIASQPQTPPEVRSASAQKTSQATNLDIDRLTEDVIRRVEKRVRIERERRGL